MGNRTSRNSLPMKKHDSRPSQTCSLNQTFDPQRFNKLHKDSHYIVLDKVLNNHLTLMDSYADTQQTATDIHKKALNIATRHHINAAYSESPNSQPVQQITHIFLNHN